MNPTQPMPTAFDSHAWGAMRTIPPHCLQAHSTRRSPRSRESPADSSWRQHILNARSIVGLVALGFVLLGADRAQAAVSITAATGGSAISADNTGGTWTTLTGPVLDESAGKEIGTGTIVLNAPSGFVFDTASTVTATVTRIAGAGTALTLSSSTATPTASTITFTVSAQDSTGSTFSRITYSNIRVRPSAGTPRANGNITKTGTSSYTESATNYGTLTEVPGAAGAYRITATTSTPAAGATDALTLRLVDQFANTVTNFTGDKILTFSGLGNAPAGTVPTVTSKTGSPVNFGTATTITLASGESSAGGGLVAYKAEGPVTLAATDGTLSTSTTGGTGVSLTVSPAAQSAYRVTAASTTPTAGASDALTIKLVDQYQNVVTSFNGDKTLTFTGPGNAPSGTIPTVTDKTGSAVALCLPAALPISSGVNSAGGRLVAYKAEGPVTLAAMDGTLSTS